ncbi:MAG: integrase core domain-containing protein, partial [Pseudomonadota bacterium]
KIRSSKTNEFIEGFNGTVLNELFREKIHETFYKIMNTVQMDLNAWIGHYNTERQHFSYCNMV